MFRSPLLEKRYSKKTTPSILFLSFYGFEKLTEYIHAPESTAAYFSDVHAVKKTCPFSLAVTLPFGGENFGGKWKIIELDYLKFRA